jgi:hypothetical protein
LLGAAEGTTDGVADGVADGDGAADCADDGALVLLGGMSGGHWALQAHCAATSSFDSATARASIARCSSVLTASSARRSSSAALPHVAAAVPHFGFSLCQSHSATRKRFCANVLRASCDWPSSCSASAAAA